jgi:hypothetical protein
VRLAQQALNPEVQEVLSSSGDKLGWVAVDFVEQQLVPRLEEQLEQMSPEEQAVLLQLAAGAPELERTVRISLDNFCIKMFNDSSTFHEQAAVMLNDPSGRSPSNSYCLCAPIAKLTAKESLESLVPMLTIIAPLLVSRALAWRPCAAGAGARGHPRLR